MGKPKITFCSGTQKVTGANFLFEIDGKKILVDCGLIQESRFADEENWKDFIYNPKDIDYLFITHAHLDHIGRIPKLVHDGFKGKIFSTPPTKEISYFIIEDCCHILGSKKNKIKDKIDLSEIYSVNKLDSFFTNWETINYHEKIKIGENLEVELYNSGHILGSAIIAFICNGQKYVFTGDLGNSPSLILPDLEFFNDASYLVIESVYGDRIHEGKKERKDKLEDAIENNVKKKGALLIPTFSLERAQELLFEIHNMLENSEVPLVPVFLDSPLAIKLTSVFKKYSNYFKDEIKKIMETQQDIFMFPGLMKTPDAEQSKMIAQVPNPKVIIAGSGMSTGGRIVHHERIYLPDPNSTLLLVGYQTLGTLGRRILDGVKKVKIFGEEIEVKAEIRTIEGYSGHADVNALLEFVKNSGDTLKKVFVTMGEPKSSFFFAQRIRDYLALYAYVPQVGETIELD